MSGHFYAISTFRVANGMEEEVRAAFEARPHLVDSAPGFVRMEVLRPQEDLAEFHLITVWESEAAFDEWHRSHAYRDSHAGMPKGLKLDPAFTKVRKFVAVAC